MGTGVTVDVAGGSENDSETDEDETIAEAFALAWLVGLKEPKLVPVEEGGPRGKPRRPVLMVGCISVRVSSEPSTMSVVVGIIPGDADCSVGSPPPTVVVDSSDPTTS